MEITVKIVLNILCHLNDLHCGRAGTPSFDLCTLWLLCLGCGSSLRLSLVLGRYGIPGLLDLEVEPQWLFTLYTKLPTLF